MQWQDRGIVVLSTNERIVPEPPRDPTAEDLEWIYDIEPGTIQHEIFQPTTERHIEAAGGNVEDIICDVCRGEWCPELLLLCDTCSLGFHIFCLTPPMQANCMPDDDEPWSCPLCARMVD